MKIRDCFEVVNIGDECLIVPIAGEASTFNGVVTVNNEAALLIECLKKEVTLKDLTEALMKEYDVDITQAEGDIVSFINKIEQMGILDK